MNKSHCLHEAFLLAPPHPSQAWALPWTHFIPFLPFWWPNMPSPGLGGGSHPLPREKLEWRRMKYVVPRRTGGKGFLKEGTGHANACGWGRRFWGLFLETSIPFHPHFFAKLSQHQALSSLQLRREQGNHQGVK